MVQKAAVVGAGGIAQVHMNNLAKLGVEIAGIADIIEERARERARRFGGRPYTSVERMLDEVSCDVVLVCTPPTAREEAVRAATSRKIPLFMEKPPAFDLESARRIRQMVEEAGIVHTVGFMWRWSKGAEACKRLLEGKKIAFIRSYYCFNVFTNPVMPRWFLNKRISGGPVLDQAIHIFDLCRFLVGDDVARVHAFANNLLLPPAEDVSAEESVIANLRYKGGIVQSHTHSWVHRHTLGAIDLFTEDLRISLGLTGTQDVSVWAGGTLEAEERFPVNESHLYEMEGFLEAVRSNSMANIRSPIGDAFKTLELCLAVNSSIESGSPVELGA